MKLGTPCLPGGGKTPYRSETPLGISAMENFTPLTATLGGLLIGFAATLLWVFNGRTAGISNIAGGIYPARRGDTLWRVAFLVGLPLGAWAGFVAGPRIFSEIPATLPTFSATPLVLIAAGLLVGIGTRVGRGCAAGHGICGLSRLSPRAVGAGAVFMATAIVTVFVTRHILCSALSPPSSPPLRAAASSASACQSRG